MTITPDAPEPVTTDRDPVPAPAHRIPTPKATPPDVVRCAYMELIVTDLAANGVRVAAVDVDAEAAERLRRDLDADGIDSVVQVGDARDPEVLEALFAAADER